MKTLTAAALILAGLISTTARAEFMSGNSLLEKMQGTQGQQLVALGYVQGVHDATTGVGVHCTPANLTAGQLNDMVRAWMVRNPEDRHRSADVIVLHVLRGTFPCADKKSSGSQQGGI